MLIDSHCHLDAAEFDQDRDAVLERARQAGVKAILIPAVERSNWGAVASLCREHPDCFPAYGIHPLYVERAQEADLASLREKLERERPVAVGEIGLDFFVAPRDETQQLRYFVEQLKLAREFDLPVILHVRRAIDPILRELRKYRLRGGIAHAFNGSRQQAEEFIKLGFVLGFGGAMTYPRALRIRELAAYLPLDAVVLETDAPDIAPEWAWKQRNEPAELFPIANVLSEIRKCPVADVISATGHNAMRAIPALSNR